jgi:short chain dehydrogenase
VSTQDAPAHHADDPSRAGFLAHRGRRCAGPIQSAVAPAPGLHGKHAIVTGGASGIGIETARALASAGADVTLDLIDLASVRAFAEQWGATPPLHGDRGGLRRRRQLSRPPGIPGRA